MTLALCAAGLRAGDRPDDLRVATTTFVDIDQDGFLARRVRISLWNPSRHPALASLRLGGARTLTTLAVAAEDECEVVLPLGGGVPRELRVDLISGDGRRRRRKYRVVRNPSAHPLA